MAGKDTGGLEGRRGGKWQKRGGEREGWTRRGTWERGGPPRF